MTVKGNNPSRSITLLSGGTGHTAKEVLAAALAQFDNPQVRIELHAHIKSTEDALEFVRQAARQHAIVCYTLVAPKIRQAVSESLLNLGVPAVDLLGPTISLLADFLGIKPRGHAGLLGELYKEKFDRIDAVDFTLAHDDGQRVHDLAEADVVLVGVSRVSKSVTCFWLASRGIRAANVPITVIHPIPEELERLDPERVIGLTMNVGRLCALRQARVDRLTKRTVGGYAEHRDVAAELRRTTSIMNLHGWRCVDISYKSIEEVASEIIQMLPPKIASS